MLTTYLAQESQESKGVGYVTFTSKEDAEKAVADLNGGQFGADAKRKIRVELANDKVGFDVLSLSHKLIKGCVFP